MFKSNIGTRTGRDVLEGKDIQCDSLGFDNFDNYFTDSAASSSPDKTNVETVRQNEVKSFLNPEKSVRDGDSPLSKLPSKKRLSFKADTASDSDSSSIASNQPPKRLFSKRGMQSIPGEDEEDEIRSLERFSPLAVPAKSFSPLAVPVKSFSPLAVPVKSFSPVVVPVKSHSPLVVPVKSYSPLAVSVKSHSPHAVSVRTHSPSSRSSHSHSEKKYAQISNRGMKSFPDDDDSNDDSDDDDDDDVVSIIEIDDSPEHTSPEPIVIEKVVEDKQPRLLSLAGGKENEENRGKIQNNENTKESQPSHKKEKSKSSTEKQTKSLPSKKDPVKPPMKKAQELPLSRASQTSNKKPSKDLSDTEESCLVEELSEVEVLVTDEPPKKGPVKPPMKKAQELPLSRASRSSNKKPSKDLSDTEESCLVEELSEVEVLVTDEPPKKSSVKPPMKKAQELPLSRASQSTNKKPSKDLSDTEESCLVEELSTDEPQKSSPESLSSIEVISKPAKKTSKSMPNHNWYMWAEDSLIDPANMVITPYGVHGDTGVTNTFQTFGNNLRVVEEDELPQPSQQPSQKKERPKSSKEKRTKTPPSKKAPVKPPMKKAQSSKKKPSKDLSDTEDSLSVLGTDKGTSVDEESSPESEESSKTGESSKKTAAPTDAKRKTSRSRSKKTAVVPKPRVSPRKQGKSPKSKTPPTAKKSTNKKSLPTEEKRKSRTSSPGKKPALSGSKKNPSPHQKKGEPSVGVKKTLSSVSKEKVPPPSPPQKNKPLDTKSKKRAASKSPGRKVPAKRAKVDDKPTATTSNHWTRASPSKVKKGSKSPAKTQKKPVSQKNNEVKSDSEQRLSVNPPHIITPPQSNIPPASSTQDLPANPSLLQSETEQYEAISLGFNSPASNLTHKDAHLNSKGSNKKVDSSHRSIDILTVFDSTDLNPKLEKNENISSHPPSDAEDESEIEMQKPARKKHSPVPLPRKRRTSGRVPSDDSVVAFSKERQTSGRVPSDDSVVAFSKEKRRSGKLGSEDSLLAFSEGYSKRISAGKSKSPAKTNPVSKGLNMSNSNSYQGPPDWQCQGCNRLNPTCLMTCIFCGLRRQEEVSQEDSNETCSDSQEEEEHWKCQSCNSLIPHSLDACILCGASNDSPGKNKKATLQELKKNEKPQKASKSPSKPVGQTSKSESPVLPKTSPKPMKRRSSFSLKTGYTFNSYANIKIDHKISYCVCSQSDTALVGMMRLQKSGSRKPNYSPKEMFFTVLEGQVRVQIGQEKRELGVHDTFVVAKDGEYSIENASTKTACLIFTIVK